MEISPVVLGILRALGVVVIVAVVGFFANAANLVPFVGEGLAGLIAMIALAVEHYLEAKNGTALFGAVRSK